MLAPCLSVLTCSVFRLVVIEGIVYNLGFDFCVYLML